MKKVINLLLGLFTFLVLFFGYSYASDPCITLGNNKICIDLDKDGREYSMSRSVTCRDSSCQVRCDVVVGDTIENVGACNGSFRYSSSSTEKIKVNININGVYGQISGKYNFKNGSWTSSSTTTSDDYRDDDDDDYYYDDDDDDDYYNDNLDISASSTTLSASQYVKLYVNTDDDYVGKVNFSLKYRSSTSSSWSSVSRTSSTYVSDYSSVWSNGYYKMTSSDDGEKTLSSLVKFKKAGYYRIYAEDENGNQDYVDIRVTSSSSSDNDNLDISASSTTLSASQYVKLYVNTDDDYVGKVNFSLKYRSSTSSSWSSVSRTSSTYVSDYSSVWSNGYYKMTSSDDGEKTLSSLVKFKKAGYYRIYAEDEDGNQDYVDIRVTSSSSSSDNDNLDISASSTTLSASQYVKLYINTDDDYVGKVNFSLKYRSSTSSSWSSVSRTSSTYVSDYSSVWSNGYYKMTSSDDGEKTLSSLVKFKKAGYYRIYAEDEDGNQDYVDIRVTSSSSSSSSNYDYVDGFSEEEYNMVKRIYNVRPTLIGQLKSENPILRNNSSWINLSNNLYSNMADVINDVYNREYSDYDEFFSAFNVWYNKTINLIN